MVCLVHHLFVLGWNVGHLVNGAKVTAVGINDRFLVNDVQLALEIIFLAEGNQNRPGIRRELLPHGVDRHVKISTDAIHLINECDPRDIVFVRLTPNRFRLRLHTGDGVEHGDRAVEHSQRAFDFRGEIHVTRRVDDVHAHLDAFKSLVDTFFLFLHPGTRGGRGSNGDAALALLLHPIGHGGAFMHFPDFVDHAGIKENTLS